MARAGLLAQLDAAIADWQRDLDVARDPRVRESSSAIVERTRRYRDVAERVVGRYVRRDPRLPDGAA